MRLTNQQASAARSEQGFSLLELLVAMTVTLVVMGLASTLIASSFNLRLREDRRTDALADAQRSLNIMSRELSNAGVNLTTNGIVASDSNVSSIRVRADLDAYDSAGGTSGWVSDKDEDVKYTIQVVDGERYLVRYDVNLGETTVLANRIDTLEVHYYNQKLDYATQAGTVAEVSPDQADFIVLIVEVTLPATGALGSSGYQPPSRTRLISDVALRNAGDNIYYY